jgi:hypothetical protein
MAMQVVPVVQVVAVRLGPIIIAEEDKDDCAR